MRKLEANSPIVPIRKMTDAALKGTILKSASSTKGCFWRDSITTKAMPETMAMANSVWM